MTATALYTGPDQGVRFDMIDGVHIVKVGAHDTGGRYEVFEIEAKQAPAAPLHRSPWTASLYLLEGTITLQVEQEAYELTAGATLTVPAGVANTFTVTSETARFLAVTTGDGAGRLFADLAQNVPTDRPFEEIMPLLLAVTERNAVTFAESGS